MFIDNFTEWLAASLVNDQNIIIMDDLTINIKKRGEDKDVTMFMNTTEALGFQQHINFSTQRIGNTLDLVLTESSEPFKIETILPGKYISDHCTVNCIISLKKMILKKHTKKFTKINKTDITKLVEDMKLDSIVTDNLEEFVDQLETNMQSAVNKNTPEITKNIVARKKEPRFTDKIKKKQECHKKKREDLAKI